jgi:hypothetical protein
MKLEKIKLSKLKSNTGQIEGLPSNPRLIKDAKYQKLVKSLQDDPEMLELRELIAYDNDGELVIIMGNMRLKALTELGIKETFVKVLPSNTPVEKLKAYTIKDNVSFGENDFDMLVNEWDEVELEEWGVDIPNFADGLDENNMTDEDVNLEQEFNEIKNPDLLRVVFIFDGKNEAESYLKSINITDCKKQGSAWQINMSSQFI